MTILSEGNHAAAFLVSEAAGTRSRERITVSSGESLVAGAVLGKVTLGAATPAPFPGNAANTGTIATVSLGAGAKAGVYRLVVIEPASNAGTFTLEDPDGVTIGTGTVGVEFTAGGLTFTLADGATDFKAGEGFTLTVAAGSGKYRGYDPANTDGSQVAARRAVRGRRCRGGRPAGCRRRPRRRGQRRRAELVCRRQRRAESHRPRPAGGRRHHRPLGEGPTPCRPWISSTPTPSR